MYPTSAHEPRGAQSIAAADATWQRRRHAAWIDYLRSTREASSIDYADAEQHAWVVLQRRLRRNDELRALALHQAGV